MIFFGLDIGSSSCKCAAFAEDGAFVAEAAREYLRVPGQIGLDADELFGYICDAISGCAARIGDKKDEIYSITVSSFGESFVPVDANGTALSGITLYTDAGGFDETAALKRRVADIGLISGAHPNSFYALPKMMAMVASSPRIRDKAWKFLQIADYAIFRLCGNAVIDYSLACRAMAFDIVNRRWSNKILAAAGFDADDLATPVPSGTAAGCIRSGLADKLGLSEKTLIIAGTHDQVASAIGAGALEAGQAVVGTGSTECVTPVFGAPVLTPGFLEQNYACVPHAVPGKYVTYAFTITGGSILAWFRNKLAPHLMPEAAKKGCTTYDLLNESCPREPSDLIVIPHFGGSGTPELAPSALGVVAGLSLGVDLPDIYRAVLEGLCFEIRYNMDILSEYGINVDSLRATGGGARSDVWLQLKADILGVRILPLATEDAGVVGGAMLAAVASGAYRLLSEAAGAFVRYREPFYPDAAMKEYYDEKFGKYKAVRKSMMNI